MVQITEKRMRELEREVASLREKISHIGYKEIVVDDTLTIDQAKSRILDFLVAHPDKNYYPDELMELLKIDVELVQKALWKLQEEGKVV